MNKSDVLELKKRFKKEACTFTRLCGCYVNSEKEKVVTFNESFLSQDEEEFYKYLEIAKKVLSGTLGNNLLELSFPLIPTGEDTLKTQQEFLLEVRDSELKDEELLDKFYDMIIEKYHYLGNYLIVVFHDAYDVMKKTKDNLQLDESEEVYQYLLCAVCPVDLSKAGLGYHTDEKRFGARVRDWVVGVPECGFLFPAFTDRSADIHNALYYTKNPKEPHNEFMEEVLGCPSVRTSFEKKESFHYILEKAFPEEEHRILDIQAEINDRVIAQKSEDPEKEPIKLTEDVIHEVLVSVNVPEELSTKIEESFSKEFSDTTVSAGEVLDNKTINQCTQRKVERDLLKQVSSLTMQLANMQEEGKIQLTVAEEKVEQIHTDYINGKKCLIIPVDDHEETSVNGQLFQA